MIEIARENIKKIRVFLVGVQDSETVSSEAREHLVELRELVRSLGLEIAGDTMVVLKRLNPQYLIGSGKAGEISASANECSAKCIVVDYDLSPSQQRNLEKLSGLSVIDRQEVILDIFADRASTKEAVIQVELARLQYVLPRLTRAWGHLSRQRGGAMGTRGEGEQQIEVDRRIVKQKISQLQKDLKEVKQHRDVQRRLRMKNRVANAAIVGYTNAGKSSLMNALCGSKVHVENRLFATLDPTTKHLKLLNNQDMLLTDTVGFVRKLPHTLVEAFKSTLEEAVLSDFIIHVLDISNPYFEEHWKTTLSVLNELGAGTKDIINVFNKIDLESDPIVKNRLRTIDPCGVFVSAKTGEGIDMLKSLLTSKIRNRTGIFRVLLPPDRYDLASFAYRNGKVLASEYEENGNLDMTMSISRELLDKFDGFIKEEF